MSTPKIFGIGLPRSAGQTLQTCLQILYPGKKFWHSPGNAWYKMDDGGPWAGAVEVFSPIMWLEANYPGSMYIHNKRDLDSWVGSCSSVYNRSGNWNHPIWRYPLSQFESYWEQRRAELERLKQSIPYQRWFEVDLVTNPNWHQLCAGLCVDVPSAAFPCVDRVKTKPKPKPELPVPFDVFDPFNWLN